MVVNAEEAPAKESIDLSAYEGLLKQYSERIQSAKDDPAEIGRIGKSLPKSWNVQAGNVNIFVYTDDLRRACEEGERVGDGKKEAANSAERRLQMMLRAAEDLERETKDAQGERAHQELNKVFARSEFSKLNGPSFLDQWNARVARWLERLAEKVFSSLHVPPTLGKIVFWPVLVIAFLALGYLALRMLEGRAIAVAPIAETKPVTEEARFWLKEALAAAERGNYREAVHCGYWAAITQLEDRRLLSQDRTRTPREYLHMLDAHPVERGILREQTTRLERIWYACREATAADWSNARLELEKMGCI
ncbi:MAG: DUF4129 domain-containing protein [Acidobacteria bacterium]|nr:DUF4129 domain-containing protein [Acidobacteriota bacterium]MBS1865448.1 DUF4129 domain-containing protein [Acidobacteriota bacterium]